MTENPQAESLAKVGKGGSPITLRDMRRVADDEANHIRTMQAALVEAGMRAIAAPSELRKAEAYDAIVRLIDRIAGDTVILARLKEGAGR